MSQQAMIISILASAASQLAEAQNIQALSAILRDATQRLGFDTFNLSVNKRSPQAFMEEPTLTTWSAGELAAYHREGWGERDPLLKQSVTARFPILWRPADWIDAGQPEYHEFLGSTGIQGGLTIPLGKVAGRVSALTMLSFRSFSADPMISDAALILGNLFSARCVALGVADRVSNDASLLRRLSGRQLETLRWVAAGKTNAEIALIMGMSRRAVDYHVAETLRKLNVVNRAQAAAIYISA